MLSLYGLGANSWAADIVQSDTDRLLLALLLEQRGQDLIEATETASDEYSDQTATYATTEVTADEEWSEPVEFGFVTSEIDLRISGADVEVAFADPSGAASGVPYSTANSPVAGIPASTSKLWVRSQSTTTATVRIEGWA